MEPLARHLAAFGQEHLLAFWEELSPSQQSALTVDIQSVDFQQLQELVAAAPESDIEDLARRAELPPAIRLSGAGNRFSREEARVARVAGVAALKASQVGVVLVAGGQGTRLGFDHPKGMFPIGPLSGHSLYQILLEKVVATSRRHGRPVPVFVMTSPATHDETIEFLQRHDRFGLPEHDLFIFCQGTMPAVDCASGNVLLAEKGRLALSPDGHGGLVSAMTSSRALASAQRRGLKHLFYMQVDNPLVAVCDAELLGHHILCGSELSTQVVAKREPRENLGNVVVVDGRLRVIEYSEFNALPDEIVLRRQENGERVFWAGNTAVHVFGVDFLARCARRGDLMPLHRVKKVVPFVDAAGKLVEPAEPNAWKFERFIFDLLPAAAEAIVVETDPRTHFAPVKNGPGQGRDTPESVKAQMIAVHREWLQSAGIELPQDLPVEIRPLFALDAEGVRERKVPEGLDAPTFLE
ncbi:MAG: UTP--glucose-1-phosphate uridylyltransferase [Planctomycetia bacterium]|nr:UTP--glucose-1-phosphate uridylyltransferase [Planctomycetia bacterium]